MRKITIKEVRECGFDEEGFEWIDYCLENPEETIYKGLPSINKKYEDSLKKFTKDELIVLSIRVMNGNTWMENYLKESVKCLRSYTPEGSYKENIELYKQLIEKNEKLGKLRDDYDLLDEEVSFLREKNEMMQDEISSLKAELAKAYKKIAKEEK